MQMPGSYNSSDRMARASMLRKPARTFPWPQSGDIDGPFVPDLSPGAARLPAAWISLPLLWQHAWLGGAGALAHGSVCSYALLSSPNPL